MMSEQAVRDQHEIGADTRPTAIPRAAERLDGVIAELFDAADRLTGVLSPVLRGGADDRAVQGTPRDSAQSGLADRIDNAADRIDALRVRLVELIERVDL